MIASIEDTVRLNNGIRMPSLGLGTWKSQDGDEAHAAVRDAIDVGYRHIDTASFYKNEASVGRAIRESGIPRTELFVTTKLWNDDTRSGQVAQALDASLRKLALEHVDLYLIHWPVVGKFVDAWRVMEDVYRQGKARAVGVSNFLPHHLDDLARSSSVTPAVNQIEFHPRLQQPALIDRCRQGGIVVEAWSPLMQGKIGDVQAIAAIARAVGKTPAQVAIRWMLQRGIVVIPKSTRRERIVENGDVFDFTLDDDQSAAIDAADQAQRLGPDPDHISF